ncbi:MAG: T9SS type A sorting domain-containing protein [Bacteroidia bacterium]|nr:T9SS type A sorting domain-containing protein [Bacteroidia bacterium]
MCDYIKSFIVWIVLKPGGLTLSGVCISFFIYAQTCTTTDASGCKCRDSSSANCDLLPDMTISRQKLTETGEVVEYPQKNAGYSISFEGADDGRLRLSVMTPNIGSGPLELRATKYLICGSDTFSTGYAGKCPNGLEPRHLVSQRIYHKSVDSISFYDRISGAMPYHNMGSNFHIGRFEYLSLRLKDTNEPDPRKWPLVAGANKNSYCLEDDVSCSAYPGSCRNQNDSILYDTDFPNFGLGGYYTCTFGIQGISPGYTDTYDKNLYGMWIDIPPGTCNGSDYYLVLEMDPDNYFLESDESNNVITLPVSLTMQDSSGNPTATIYSSKPPVISPGDSLMLSATAAYSYKWSTGDTSSSIIVKTGGSFMVTVSSPCGTASSAPLTVNMLSPPLPPVVVTDTICVGDSARLTASGTDSLVWYEKANKGKIIGIGSIYVTPPLTNSTTYYVENIKTIEGLKGHIGKADTNGAGKYYKGTSYLAFDCISPFKLEYVTVYSDKPGNFNIVLIDWSGFAINTKQVSLVSGKNRVALGFIIAPEYNYQLRLVADTAYAFYGNYGNVSYPFTMQGVVAIKASGFGKSDYVGFYDWEIKTIDFHPASARIPVTAVVDQTCILGARRLDDIMPDFRISPSPFSDKLIIKAEGTQEQMYLLSIYDITGRTVRAEYFQVPGILEISRIDLASGIYIYKITKEKIVLAAGKIIAE